MFSMGVLNDNIKVIVGHSFISLGFQEYRILTTSFYFSLSALFLHLQISNTQGELYSISLRGPHFNWIQDFSPFDKVFTVTPGNNGFLYVTIPVKALVFALDTLSGTILWQKSIGPLSTIEYRPVVDSNGNYALYLVYITL